MNLPDVNAEILPGVSAAGFSLGEELSSVLAKVGAVKWAESESVLNELVGDTWVGFKRKLHLRADSVTTLHYGSVVRLDFWNDGPLYQLIVGGGYMRDFCGVSIGDGLQKLADMFSIEFESSEDVFCIGKEGEDVSGIAFVTDHNVSLEYAPKQTIEGIMIFNYAITKS